MNPLQIQIPPPDKELETPKNLPAAPILLPESIPAAATATRTRTARKILFILLAAGALVLGALYFWGRELTEGPAEETPNFVF